MVSLEIAIPVGALFGFVCFVLGQYFQSKHDSSDWGQKHQPDEHENESI